MRTLRRRIQLKDGVEVETLFTPHLFSYKDERGLTLEATSDELVKVLEVYADIYFLAAINAWALDGKGTAEEFPYTRGDFHEYMAANPKTFVKDVDFAVEALTGKSTKEIVEKQAAEAPKEEDASKKKASRWIGRLLRHSS